MRRCIPGNGEKEGGTCLAGCQFQVETGMAAYLEDLHRAIDDHAGRDIVC